MKNKFRGHLTGTWTMVVIGFALALLLVNAQTTKAQWTTNGNDVYKTNTSGNVGVGMTSPAAKVDITTIPYDSLANIKANISSNAINLSSSYNGSSYAPGITWTPTNLSTIHPAVGIWAFMGGSGSYLQFGTTNTYGGITNTAMTIDYNGNVGIGTTSPTSKLTVATDGNYEIEGSGTSGFDITTPATTGGYVALSSRRGTGIFIDTSNNVGIGKTNPTVPLDVVGDINLTGTIHAKYQDVAEWVPSSDKLSTGTVVVLDSTKSNQVTSSSVSYDTRVAGVVSEQPGIALGEKSENKVLVATTGRVRVKVDASKGAIHIGDLLVTSDVPGMAMKSEPILIGGRQIHSPGTLIGKALEPMDKGTGTILVLLSLQ